MSKYHVYVPEVHYQQVAVEAASPEEAAKLVQDGEGDVVDDTLEYSHGLESSTQMVVEIDTGESYTVKLDGEEG
jgi:hypothetical protein